MGRVAKEKPMDRQPIALTSSERVLIHKFIKLATDMYKAALTTTHHRWSFHKADITPSTILFKHSVGRRQDYAANIPPLSPQKETSSGDHCELCHLGLLWDGGIPEIRGGI